MNKIKSTDTLIIFVKLPRPGKVKTRLAKDLGEEKAAELYSLMARDIILRTSKSSKFNTAIFFDPPGKKDEIYQWLNDIDNIEEKSLFPQQGDTLGERITNAFELIFSKGADKAVIIGTDCIEVTPEMIEDTLKSLNEHDCIIGPAQDGGYYLLALSRHIPELFIDINWSTGRVYEQTVEHMNNLGLNYKILDTLSDIDELRDLKELPPEYNFK